MQYATSLRVSRYGYSNALQRSYPVSFNSLDEYVQSLRTLLATPSRQYEKIGLYKDGRRIQLNSNVLQKESEFYSSIRLKQLVGQGEKHLDALQRKGVSYAEIRLLDLNPFERTGVSMKQLQFLHTFLLFCLLKPSPPISRTDWNSIHENHHRISLYGRKPGLKLRHDTKGEIGRNEWMEEIAGGLGRVAELLDQAEGGSAYREIVREEIEKGRTGRTLSAVIRQEMDANRETFLQYGIRRAKLNQKKAAKTAVNGRNHDVF